MLLVQLVVVHRHHSLLRVVGVRELKENVTYAEINIGYKTLYLFTGEPTDGLIFYHQVKRVMVIEL